MRRKVENMKRTICSLSIAVLCWATISLAADEKDFQTWMKTAGGTIGGLKKALDAKTNGEAAQAARKLEDVFSHVETYMTEHKVQDGAGYAKDAGSAAKQIAAAADAGNASDASAGFSRLGGACKSCHDAHREKLDGGFRFKP
jgi:cytochrome c556